MDISIIFSFLKNYYKEVIIGILSITLWFMHINNNILESELALSKQQVAQEQDKLTVSNASITDLQASLSLQNQKLKELGTKTNANVEISQRALQEALKENDKLQQKLDMIKDKYYDDSKDECYNIHQLLKDVGE